MPIKYTLTKNDMLADKIHDCVMRSSSNSGKEPTQEDVLLRTQATIIASLASSWSWQTSKALKESNLPLLMAPEVKNEYSLAAKERWKQIRSADIQEVASMNIGTNFFSMWLLSNVGKGDHELYKKAWDVLRQEFAQVCDDISGGNR